MNFLRREFLTDIDFWSVGVIQGLILNLNVYLLTFLYDAWISKIESIWSKQESLGRNPWMDHYAHLVQEFQTILYQSNQE